MGHDANPPRVFIDQNVVGSLMRTLGEYMARDNRGVGRRARSWSVGSGWKGQKSRQNWILEPGGERCIE